MIWAMVIVATLGCIMLSFVDPLTEPLDSKMNTNESLWESVKGMVPVAMLTKSMVLAPAVLLQGCNLAFAFGSFPKFVKGGSVEVAEVFLFFGMSVSRIQSLPSKC